MSVSVAARRPLRGLVRKHGAMWRLPFPTLRVFAVCAAAVAAASCATVRTASSPDAGARVLRVGLVQQPNSLDPLHAVQFYENYLAEATSSALVVLDDSGNPSPDLAREVPTLANGGISRDGKTIIYHLRPNLRWQDGVRLTSRDVAYTFARMMDPKTAFPEATVYSAIASLATPDAATVVLHLRSPWADATSQLFVGGQDGSIVPEHVLRGVTDLTTSTFEAKPLGSGPYTVESWRRGDRIVLRANPLYFRGRPAIDRIDVVFVPDANTLNLRVKSGELDFSPQITTEFAASLHDTPALRVRAVPTYTAVEIGFEGRVPPFDDARVRRALLAAVDRRRIVTTVYRGFAVAADDLVPPQSAFHVAAPEVRESGDLRAAGALLDAAGWQPGAGGVRRKDGRPLAFSLTVASGYEALLKTAVQVQSTWRALGADVALRPIQVNMMYAPGTGVMQSGNFQAALYTDGYATSPDRADTLSTAAIPPGGRNYYRFSDRDVDRWTAAARVNADATVRRRLYAAIARRVRELAPAYPLLWIDQRYVYTGALDGFRPEPVNSDFWNVWAWRWR